jgi:hypothetical protein
VDQWKAVLVLTSGRDRSLGDEGHAVLVIRHDEAVPVQACWLADLVLDDHVERLAALRGKAPGAVRLFDPERLGCATVDGDVLLDDPQHRRALAAGRRLRAGGSGPECRQR